MYKKYHISECDFPITNICNFNCQNCNRFNNYAFSGYQTWVDYKDTYKKWSNIISLDSWSILGGEPTTNKDYLSWIKGIHELWPAAKGRLITNGSLLKPDDTELYNTIKNTNGMVFIEIGLHNQHRLHEIVDFCLKFLKNPWPNKEQFNQQFINFYNNIKGSTWPACQTVSDWYNLPKKIRTECDIEFGLTPFKLKDRIINDIKNSRHDMFSFTDENNVSIQVYYQDHFFHSALIPDYDNNVFRLHNNDKVLSHNGCMERRGECPQFIEGKLYKCSVSKSLPDFEKQYNIEVSDADRKLMHSYIPADVNFTDNELDNWFDKRNDPIEMCKFCTMDYTTKQIFAEKKKVFFKKKTKSQQ